MAKTVLDLEGGSGTEKVIEQFERLLSVGEGVVKNQAEYKTAAQKSAEASLDAQSKLRESLKLNGQEIVKTGTLQKQLMAEITKGHTEQNKAIVQQIANMGGLSKAEVEARTQLGDLVKEFEKLSVKAQDLEKMANALGAYGEIADGVTVSIGEQTVSTAQLVAERAKLDAALAANRAEAEKLTAALELMNKPAQQPQAAAPDLNNTAQIFALAETRAGILVNRIAQLRTELDKIVERSQEAEKIEFDPSPKIKILIDDIEELQNELTGLKLPDTSKFVQGAQKALEPIKLTNEEIDELKKKVQQVDPEPIVSKAVSLRTQLNQAVAEVGRLSDGLKDGEVTPELAAAAEKAAKLRSEMQDVEAVIEGLDPDAKFKAVAGLTQSILAGFTAIQGVLTVIDSSETGENALRNLAKIQGLLAFFQGANVFLGDFGKQLKALNAFVVANTVATTANTATKGANTAATAASAAATATASGATGVLTTAVRGLTAAMAANPLITAVVLLTSIAAALVLTGNDAEDATKEVEKLVDAMDELRDMNARSQSLLQRKMDLEDELWVIQQGNTEAAKREQIERRAGNERRRIQEGINLLIEQEAELRTKANLAEMAGNDEAAAQFKERAKERTKAIEQAEDERTQVSQRATLELAQFDDNTQRERAEKRKALIEVEAKYRLKMAEDIAKAEEAIEQRVKRGSFDANIAELELRADEAAKAKQFQAESEFRQRIIAIKEEAAQKEIGILQQSLQRKVALATLEQKQVEGLTQAQQDALADRIIAEGKANLTEEQMVEFRKLRAQVTAEYERQTTAVVVSETAKRVAAADEEIQRQVDLMDKREEIANIRLEAAHRDKEEMLAILREFGVKDVESVRSVEEAKLRLTIAGMEARKAALESLGQLSEEQALEVEKINAEIEKTKTAIEDLKPLGIDWAKLLGLDADEFAKVEGLIGQMFGNLYEAINNSLFTDRIEQIDRYLDKLNESISETEEAIDREQEAKEEGLTNNLKAEKDRLAQLQQMEEEAVKQKEKLAKRQQIADSIAAQSGMVLSVVNLIKDGASFGVIGLAAAAAAIPLIFALINASKKQAADVARFFKGTDYVQLGGNPKGVDTVPAMLSEGEGVMRAEDNAAMPSLMKGVHRKDKDLVERGIAELMKRYNIDLEDVVERLSPAGIRARMPAIPSHFPEEMRAHQADMEDRRQESAANRAMERHMQRMADTNEELLRIERDRKSITYIPKGGGGFLRIEHRGNVRNIKQPDEKE